MRIATICSGIGAPEKALRNLGINYELAYFCEFDKYASQSYCAVHDENECKNLGDLTKVEIDKLPHDLDLIVGGTPCQDFSLAGKRKGGEIDSGTRSSLMWNFVEIIRETKPKAVLWENVPGCLTGKMKVNYDKFIFTLNDLGYKTYAEILNAKYFGVPQNRDRVFVLAVRKDLGIEFKMPKGYDCGIRLKDVLERDADRKYYISTQKVEQLLNTTFHQSSYDVVVQKSNEICSTLCARDYKDPKCVELTSNQSQGNRVYDPNGISVTLSANGGGMGAKTGLYVLNEKEKLCEYLIDNNLVKENDVIRHSYSNYKKENASIKNITSSENNISPTLDTRCDCLGVVIDETQLTTKNKRLKEMLPKIDVSKTQAIDIYNKSTNEIMHTLKANINSANMTAVTQNLAIRKLTPKECWRLMGFSDTDFEKAKDSPMSDSQLYKQAGNSIVVNVLMAIFGELYKVDWKPLAYGKWYKSETERLYELPLFQNLKGEKDE